MTVVVMMAIAMMCVMVLNDEGAIDQNAALRSVPAYEPGAVVRAIHWTDGGGHTSKAYAE